MERLLIGTDARWFVDDVEMLFGAGVSEPILIGMDLARGSDSCVVGDAKPLLLLREDLREAKRTHPTTARELRRAERRRRP